jgi:sugar/nucleoside kinase (ribokinase family)
VHFLPVSKTVRNELKYHNGGDTTGCGDNFVGGLIASLVKQLINGTDKPDLNEACSLGIVSGGFACFYMGGTFFENTAGEKIARLKPYYDSYRKQISEL